MSDRERECVRVKRERKKIVVENKMNVQKGSIAKYIYIIYIKSNK